MPRLERPWSGPPFDAFTLNQRSPQAAGLLAWWPTLFSRGRAVLMDAVLMRAGTFANAPTWQGDGEHGVRLNLTRASTQYVVTTVASPTAAPFTLTGWIRPASAGAYRAIFGCSANGGVEWRISNTEKLELLQQSTAVIATSTGTVTNGSWNHIALVYGVGGAWVMYVNGASAGSGTNSVSFTAGTFDIGRHPTLGGEEYDGQIGELRYYGRALTASEVLAQWARSGWWDLYAPVKRRVNYIAPPVAVISDPGLASMPVPFILRPRAVPQARYQFMYYNPQRELRGILTGHGPAAYTTSSDSQGSGFSMELVKTDPKLVRDGGFVLPYRKVDGGIWRYQDTYLVASRPQAAATKGTQFKDIEGDSLTKWLTAENRRVIGLIDSTLGSYVTDVPADNALKYFIARAMGAGAGNSGTSRGRDLGFWLNLTTAKDQSLGPTIDYNASLKPLSTVIKDIIGLAELDKNKPVRLFVYVRPRTESPRLTFEVVTVVGQLPSASKPKKKRGAFGVYRGFDSAYPVILGPMFGNVSQIESEHDLREGWNSVVGTWNNKLSTTRITDTRAAAEFPAAFGEVYEDAANSGTEADAQVELRAKLLAGRPRDIHKLTLQDTLFCVFEKDYFLGDIVGVRLDDGRSFEAELTGAQHVLDPGGLPQVTVRAEELLPIVF